MDAEERTMPMTRSEYHRPKKVHLSKYTTTISTATRTGSSSRYESLCWGYFASRTVTPCVSFSLRPPESRFPRHPIRASRTCLLFSFRCRENTVQMGQSPRIFPHRFKKHNLRWHTDGHKRNKQHDKKKKRQSWINVTTQGGWIHDYHPVSPLYSLSFMILLFGDKESTLYFKRM